MGAFASINIAVGGETAGMSAELAKAKTALSGFDRDVSQNKGGGGFLSSLGQSLRQQAMEERRGGLRQLEQLAMGRAPGMTGVAAEVLDHMASKAKEVANEFLSGKVTAGGMVERLAEGLPVVGRLIETGRHIVEAWQDMHAAIARANGASHDQVIALMSEETRTKRLKEEKEALEAVQHRLNELTLQNAMIGRHGDALVVAKARQDAAAANDELRKLAEEMNDPQNNKWNLQDGKTKQAIYDQRAAALGTGVQGRREESQKDDAEQRNRSLLDAEVKLNDMRAALSAENLRNTGQTWEATKVQATAAYNHQIMELQRWAAEQKKAHPEVAAMIDREAKSQEWLLNAQREATVYAKLNADLASIAADAKDAGLDPVEKRIAALKREHASTLQVMLARKQLEQEGAAELLKAAEVRSRDAGRTEIERQVEALRRMQTESKDPQTQAKYDADRERLRFDLQRAEDKERAKAMAESLESPLEKYKDETAKLARMREEGAFRPVKLADGTTISPQEQFDRASRKAALDLADSLPKLAERAGPAVTRRFDFNVPTTTRDPLADLPPLQKAALQKAADLNAMTADIRRYLQEQNQNNNAQPATFN